MSSVLQRARSRWRDATDLTRSGGTVIRTAGWLERRLPGIVWGMPDPEPTSPIHLTFDDGPAGDATERVLDILRKHGAPATFFLGGEKLASDPGTVASIQAHGHRIGYHGLTHETWWFRDRVHRQLEMDPAFIKPLGPSPFSTPASHLLLRAPYGRVDLATLGTARELGASLVHWRLAVRDWVPGMSAVDLARRLYRHTWPGDIVVLHDGGPSARAVAGALDLVIPAWRRAGMTLSTIDPFLARTS